MDRKQAAACIVQVCQTMWQKGWVAANDGNVSQRLDNGTILATPTMVSKNDVREDMLVLLSPQGRILSGTYKPSSEIRMHLRCYEMRPDIFGVVHTHSPAATAFAAAAMPLDLSFLTEAYLTLGNVPVAPFALPSTDEVPDSITPYLKEHNAILLQNHGALALGTDVKSAYFCMESLEHCAAIALNVRLLGGGCPISEENKERLKKLYS